MNNQPPAPSPQSQGVKRQGLLFVVSAPSGAGKTTLCKEIIDFFPGLRQSVSYTTRAQREGELDGVHYNFVTRPAFDLMVEEGAFAEWAEVHGNCYGTALETLSKAQSEGVDILLEIDFQGAAQIKEKLPGAVFIFILPPDFDELRRRLVGRGTDSPEVIERRIGNAAGEISEAIWYDYVVVNDDFSVAAEEFKAVILAEGCRREKVLPALEGKFDFQV